MQKIHTLSKPDCSYTHGFVFISRLSTMIRLQQPALRFGISGTSTATSNDITYTV